MTKEMDIKALAEKQELSGIILQRARMLGEPNHLTPKGADIIAKILLKEGYRLPVKLDTHQ